MTQPSRRQFLAAGCAGAALTALPRIAVAALPSDRRLVVVLLRGGLDGLAAVPVFESAYAGRRRELALDPGAAPLLDGPFALHPALAPLVPFWAAGELAIAHAAGHGFRTRSHFDAQDLLESGLADKRGLAGGWLGRALKPLQAAAGSRRLGLAVGGSIPLLLRGEVAVASWEPPGLRPAADDYLAALLRISERDPMLGPALAQGVEAQTMSGAILGREMQPGARGFGPGSFKPLAAAAGRLLAAPAGPRVAALEMGGWDTHAGQGAESGRLAQNLAGFADGLLALAEGLGAAWRQTVVVAATEFGRTVAMNGSGGTDHGTASVLFLLGGALRGGRVLGDWPGLDRLEEDRDLVAANDGRSFIRGVLRDHLGLEGAALAAVFPDSPGLPAVGDLIRG